jgi:hypothetical protein
MWGVGPPTRRGVPGAQPRPGAPGVPGTLGLFADEIRQHGTYSAWAATWPYLRDPWVATMGPNRYVTSRLAFLQTWTGQPTLTADAMGHLRAVPLAQHRGDRPHATRPRDRPRGRLATGPRARRAGIRVRQALVRACLRTSPASRWWTTWGWRQALPDGGAQPSGPGAPRRGRAGGDRRVAPRDPGSPTVRLGSSIWLCGCQVLVAKADPSADGPGRGHSRGHSTRRYSPLWERTGWTTHPT